MSFLQKMKQQKLLSVTLLLFTLVLGIIIGTVINTGVRAERQTPAVAPDATPLAIPQAQPIANDFTKLTKRVEPSVVYIESDYLPKPGKRTHRDAEDEDDDNSGATPPKSQDPSDLFK